MDWVAFLGAVCTLPMFSLAGGLPHALYGGIGEVRGPYTEPPPPYKAPLHCLLYYWPPHMEPTEPCNIIICPPMPHHQHRAAHFAFQSLIPFWEEAPLPFKESVALSPIYEPTLPNPLSLLTSSGQFRTVPKKYPWPCLLLMLQRNEQQ